MRLARTVEPFPCGVHAVLPEKLLRYLRVLAYHTTRHGFRVSSPIRPGAVFLLPDSRPRLASFVQALPSAGAEAYSSIPDCYNRLLFLIRAKD